MDTPFDHSVEEEVRRELLPGEHILWRGRPRAGIRLRASDALLIPFSLMWGGFAVFWEATTWTSNAPFFFRLWGIPFVLAGAYITVGRFFFDAFLRSRTVYGLTEHRAIIVSTLLTRKVRSVDLRTTTEVAFTESRDRTGTITFGPSAPFGRGSRAMPPQFEFVEEGRAVYERTMTLQRAAKSSA